MSFFRFSLVLVQDSFKDGFEVVLASIFRPFWVPNPSQDASENLLKKSSHLESFFYRFLMDLGSHLGSKSAPKSAQKGVKKRSEMGLKSSSQKSSQNDPKMAPKGPQNDPPRHRFSRMLGMVFLANSGNLFLVLACLKRNKEKRSEEKRGAERRGE